ATLGLPKLYAPLTAPDEAGGIRFTARLSSSLPWQVTVTDPAGAVVGTGHGTLGAQSTTALQIAVSSTDPLTLSPNGDGQGDTAEVGFTLAADANVGADVLDPTGTVVAQAAPLRWRRAGERTIIVAAGPLADGTYTLRLTAKAAGG